MSSSQQIRIRFTEDMDGLLDSLRHFVALFELVFDLDWEMTQACIRDSEHMISEDGTFIHPMVDDESNNWWNRGAILASYRDLVERMEALGIDRTSWNGDVQSGAKE